MYEGSLLVARISMVDVSQCASEQVWSWFLNPPQDLCCTLTGDLMVQCRHALENLKDLFVFLARTANSPGYHSSECLSALDQRVLWHCLLHCSFVFINFIQMSNLHPVCNLSGAQISISVQDLPTVTYWQRECK